jgi:hypothetical protein
MTSSFLRSLLALALIAACAGELGPTGSPPSPAPGPSGGGGGGSDDDVGGGGSPDEGGGPSGTETFECADGLDPIFHPASDVTSAGGRFASGVRRGSGGEPMTVTCGETNCLDGQVGVEQPENPILGTPGGIQCVEAPPECAAGTSPFWVGSVLNPLDGLGEVGGFWTCSQPCEVVVDFGGLYGFQSACTGPPPSCPGSTPTFQFESQQWQCAPMCDGGLYDPVEFEGETVCVPC